MTSSFHPHPAPVNDSADAGQAGAGGDAGQSASMHRFGRLPTTVKLIALMLLALAPLMMIAVLASMETARNNRATRMAASVALAAESGRQIDILVARTALTLRASGTALLSARGEGCMRTLEALAASHRVRVDFALRDHDGRLVCATRGYHPDGEPVVTRPQATIRLSPDGQTLTVLTLAGNDQLIGEARFSQATVAATARPRVAEDSYRLVLKTDGHTMPLGGTERGLAGGTTVTVPVVDGEGRLELTLPVRRPTASEILSVLLPVVMLVAAGMVAFLVMDRLMLRPLKQLQAAVLAYGAGESALAMPPLTTPAHEIRTLADAFRNVTRTITRHETDLEEGLARQTRLTREVHHRVKNNLQVVASLLSLHARGARSQDVADAYAAIQRRVDALAVVHRNHYAELEENRGVALRPLIGELAANLRATAPPKAMSMPIILDLASLYATQDVAVPVAFLVTEMVESAMLRTPKSTISVSLKHVAPGRAVLTATGKALTAGQAIKDAEQRERAERVLAGLARQLRSTLERDEIEGTMAIEIAVVD